MILSIKCDKMLGIYYMGPVISRWYRPWNLKLTGRWVATLCHRRYNRYSAPIKLYMAAFAAAAATSPSLSDVRFLLEFWLCFHPVYTTVLLLTLCQNLISWRISRNEKRWPDKMFKCFWLGLYLIFSMISMCLWYIYLGGRLYIQRAAFGSI